MQVGERAEEQVCERAEERSKSASGLRSRSASGLRCMSAKGAAGVVGGNVGSLGELFGAVEGLGSLHKT